METRKKAADMSVKELASYIDQSVLKPEFTQDDIRKYIQEGIDYGLSLIHILHSSMYHTKDSRPGFRLSGHLFANC